MKRHLPAAGAALLLTAAGITPAKAQQCNLAGSWEATMTLSHLDDAEAELVPWPPDTVICALSFDKLGALSPLSACEHVNSAPGMAPPQASVSIGAANLVFHRRSIIDYPDGVPRFVRCRLSAEESPVFTFEMEEEIVQTQDIYQCLMSAVQSASGTQILGFLDCSGGAFEAPPEAFEMIKR